MKVMMHQKPSDYIAAVWLFLSLGNTLIPRLLSKWNSDRAALLGGKSKEMIFGKSINYSRNFPLFLCVKKFDSGAAESCRDASKVTRHAAPPLYPQGRADRERRKQLSEGWMHSASARGHWAIWQRDDVRNSTAAARSGPENWLWQYWNAGKCPPSRIKPFLCLRRKNGRPRSSRFVLKFPLVFVQPQDDGCCYTTATSQVCARITARF